MLPSSVLFIGSCTIPRSMLCFVFPWEVYGTGYSRSVKAESFLSGRSESRGGRPVTFRVINRLDLHGPFHPVNSHNININVYNMQLLCIFIHTTSLLISCLLDVLSQRLNSTVSGLFDMTPAANSLHSHAVVPYHLLWLTLLTSFCTIPIPVATEMYLPCRSYSLIFLFAVDTRLARSSFLLTKKLRFRFTELE
jgi:hypothetical protein